VQPERRPVGVIARLDHPPAAIPGRLVGERHDEIGDDTTGESAVPSEGGQRGPETLIGRSAPWTDPTVGDDAGDELQLRLVERSARPACCGRGYSTVPRPAPSSPVRNRPRWTIDPADGRSTAGTS
jgi:hypothetical protein